jgi:2-dehydro-3-deoxyphosphogluconate aldolase / (4S)-4-hydroxy-2-oxoglutarate aldolase
MKLTMPVIGILRGVESSFFQEAAATAFDGGLQAIEVTMNTPGALQIIESYRKSIETGQYLGVGTICTVEDARRAIDAGAMFLVTPQFSYDVVAYAVEQGVPIVAGGLTPTEIYDAWKAGAYMVKVFPCGAMGGPGYIKDLRGPFDSLPLAAVGGVSFDNLQDYFEAGVQAVGVSTALFGKEALVNRDLTSLGRNVRKFTACVEEILQGLE